MVEQLEISVPVEISDTHIGWLEDALEEDMVKEDVLSQFIAGQELEMQLEEFIHNLHQQEKRSEEGGQRRNPMG